MRKKIITSAVLTVFLFLFAIPASALVYYFNTANTIGTWSGSTTMPGYGSVEITKTVDNWVNFEVIANPDYFVSDPTERSGLTWDKFFFNFNPDKSIVASSIVVNAEGTWNLITDQNVSSFGIFEFGETGTALPPMVNPLEFTIQDTTLDILDFVYPNMDGNIFAGHLRRFGDGNEDSIYLAVAPVPEPGTLILIGSGLAGLLLYRKRRME